METAIRFSAESTPDSPQFLHIDVVGKAFSTGCITSWRASPGHVSSWTRMTRKVDYRLSPQLRQGIPAFRAIDWVTGLATFQREESAVALGTFTGDVCVLRLGAQSPSDGAAKDSHIIAKYSVKNPRACNAVAFGDYGIQDAEESVLSHGRSKVVVACGLERLKTDACLYVWDASRALCSNLSPVSSSIEPLRKFSAAEAVTSLKFFPHRPDLLLAGTRGIGVRCYDLRNNTGNAVAQFTTDCFRNIAIDRVDERYFACASGSQKTNTIQIWDSRFAGAHRSESTSTFGSTETGLSGPTITYTDIFRTPSNQARTETEQQSSELPVIWSLRYCSTRSGLLGALASNGSFSAFDMRSRYAGSTESISTTEHVPRGKTTGEVDGELYTRYIHRLEPGNDTDARLLRAPVVSFDWATMHGPKQTPTLLVLRRDSTVEIRQLPSLVKGVAQSHIDSMIAIKGPEESNSPSNVTDEIAFMEPLDFASHRSILDKLNVTTTHGGMASREAHERMFGVLSATAATVSIPEALTLASLPRERCLAGYMFDYQNNLRVLGKNRWLCELWHWIHRAKKYADDGKLRSGGFDFSYSGIVQIWGQYAATKQTRKANARHSGATGAIRHIVRAMPSLAPVAVETQHLERRQLCLLLLGYGLPLETLGSAVDALINRKEATRAIVVALIHGQSALALKIVQTAEGLPRRELLSLAIAGFTQGSTGTDWSDVVHQILEELNDPYARAIFTLAKRGNWRDIVYETSIPLLDRLAVAITYLPDDEISRLIHTSSEAAIIEGDIEGVVLTGLTKSSIPLFQMYASKFADMQTAVLALSHSFPLIYEDARVSEWQKLYRQQLKMWKLHTKRAIYDSGLTRLSTAPNGHSKFAPAKPQITLRCTFCDGSLSHSVPQAISDTAASPLSLGGETASPNTAGSISHQGSIFSPHSVQPSFLMSGIQADNNSITSPGLGSQPVSMLTSKPSIPNRQNSKTSITSRPNIPPPVLASGTVCPRCGRHMPRCAICLQWLGGSRPVARVRDTERRQSGEANNKEEHGVFEDDGNGSQSWQTAMDAMMSICLMCNHATHRGHAREWFDAESVCPVISCDCHCMQV